MKPDGSDLRVVTSGPGIHEVPSWSPSGRRIIFGYSPEQFDPEAPEGFETRLWTMRADGSHARPLPMRRPGFDVEARYSPNGRWIVFARNRPPTKKRELQTAIMIVRAKGGRVRRLTPWADYQTSRLLRTRIPSTPPGRPTAAGSSSIWGRTGRSRRCARTAATATRSSRPARASAATSPGTRQMASRILFVCENWGTLPEPPEGFNDDICVMNADGTNVVNLTNTREIFENWPSWGPAPR